MPGETTPAPRRRQFRVAALFVAMLAASLPFSWIARRQRESEAQAAATQRIQDRGGQVHTQPYYSWVTVDLDHSAVVDSDLALLRELAPVETLYLGQTNVTDAGLAHLAPLGNLAWLDLRDTKITDAGLEHLRGLRNLRMLRVQGSKITRAGFERLKQALPELETDPWP